MPKKKNAKGNKGIKWEEGDNSGMHMQKEERSKGEGGEEEG